MLWARQTVYNLKMSLNMLVSGADCGPVNPLQGLAKRFEQDRGVQQVSITYSTLLESVVQLKDVSSSVGLLRTYTSRALSRGRSPTHTNFALV